MLAIGACAFDTEAVPQQIPLVEVHAILNPSAPNKQIVIVERVLGGAGTGASASGGVIPVYGAQVTVTGPTGHVYVGVPVDTVTTEPGQPGLVDSLTEHYEFSTDFPNVLLPGSIYTLRVVTPEGEVVTGSTRIPFERPISSTTSLFNRDVDTLALTWTGGSGGASYWLRAEGLSAAFEQFLDSTQVRIAGGLQALDLNGNPDRDQIFTPGFVTPVTVAAIDQNCYDYFRTVSDPFTGLGRINHLVGGYGVFGSLALAVSTSAEVIETVTDPLIEGHWKANQKAGAGARALELRLFVDHEHPSGDPTVTPLSGSYTPDGLARAHLVGTRVGSEVVVALFTGSSPVPDDLFTGTVGGNTLRGSYSSDGESVTFTRIPP